MKKATPSSLSSKKGKRVLLFPLVATSLILTACGGNNNSSQPAASSQSSTTSSQTSSSKPADSSKPAESSVTAEESSSNPGTSSAPASSTEEAISSPEATSPEESSPALTTEAETTDEDSKGSKSDFVPPEESTEEADSSVEESFPAFTEEETTDEDSKGSKSDISFDLTSEVSLAEPSISIVDVLGNKECTLDIKAEMELVIELVNIEDDATVVSSDPDVAIFDEYESCVKAVGTGTATITVTAGSYSDTYTVHVNAVSITIIAPDALYVGREANIDYSVDGILLDDFPDFVVETPDILELSSNDEGPTVKGLAEGEGKISVTVNGVKEEKTIAVSEVPLDAISFEEGEEASVGLHDTLTLNLVGEPEDAKIEDVVWASDDEDVATVADGVVTPVDIGECNITATVGEKIASIAVTVEAPVFDPTSINIPSAFSISGTATTFVDKVHEGKTIDDALLYEAEEDGLFTVPVAAEANTAIRYVKFEIEEEGDYRLYNNGAKDDTDVPGVSNGLDGKLIGVATVDPETGVAGNVDTSISNDDVGFSDPAKNAYAPYKYNFYKETHFEAGVYVAQLQRYGSGAGVDLRFGISNVAEDETNNTIFASTPFEEKIASEIHSSIEVVPGEGIYINSSNDRYVIVLGMDDENNIYQASPADDDGYQVLNSASPVGVYEDGAIDLGIIAIALGFDAAALQGDFIEIDEGGCDVFSFGKDSFFAVSLATALDFALFFDSLTVAVSPEGELAYVIFESSDPEIESFELSVDAIESLSVDISFVDVGNAGEFPGEGGANQDW